MASSKNAHKKPPSGKAAPLGDCQPNPRHMVQEGVVELVLGKPMDFKAIEKRLSIHFTHKYGDNGTFIKRRELNVAVYVPAIEAFGAEIYNALPVKEKSSVNGAAQSTFMSDRRQLAKDNTAMFWELLLFCDPQGREKIEATPAYIQEDLSKTPNPLVLWMEIVKVYQATKISTVADPAARRHEARAAYNTLRQGERQSDYDFKCEFDGAIAMMAIADVPAMDQSDLAMDFLSKIDRNRYIGLIESINNNRALGAGERPETVEAAYGAVCDYERPSSTRPMQDIGRHTAYVAAVAPVVAAERRYDAPSGSSAGDRAKKRVSDKPAGKCYNCGKPGHFAKECRGLKAQRRREGSDTDGGESAPRAKKGTNSMAITYAAGDIFSSGNSVDSDEFVWDSGSSCHIVNDLSLLTDVHVLNKPVILHGVAGNLTCTKSGIIPVLGAAFYHAKAPANLISVPLLEDNDAVILTYTRGVDRVISTEDGAFRMTFKRGKAGVYTGRHAHEIRRLCTKHDMRTTLRCVTVRQQMDGYTRQEVAKAQLVQELIARLGYPGVAEVHQMIQRGTLMDLSVSSKDLTRYVAIYGRAAADAKGKMVDTGPRKLQDREQVLTVPTTVTVHSDIVYIMQETFLISVIKPINLIIASQMLGRSSVRVKEALHIQLSMLRSKKFEPTGIHCDNEACLVSIVSVDGVELHHTGSGSHEPIVERAVRVIQERVRCICASLPYRLPRNLLKWCVYYAATMINIMPRVSGIGVSGREAFTGSKVSYKKDIAVSFGQYAMVYRHGGHPNRVTQERSAGCIALLPVMNGRGSYRFYCLATGKVITSDNFTTLPMPDEAIIAMDNLWNQVAADTPGSITPNGNIVASDVRDERTSVTDGQDTEREGRTHNGPNSTTINSEPTDLTADASDEVPEARRMTVALGGDPQGPSDDEEYFDAISDSSVTELEESAHICFNMSMSEAVHVSPDCAETAITKELRQMDTKGVWSPIKPDTVHSLGSRVIPSRMFLREKTTEDGQMIFKARLVAGGHMQERDLFATSSPTVTTEALFTVLAIASSERRSMGTMDIQGAYLEADMVDDVYMRLDPQVSSYMCKINGKYGTFCDSRGRIVVKLCKALYGCKQSGARWYSKLADTLNKLGYVRNEKDWCLFNKHTSKGQITAATHVDDLLITGPDATAVDDAIKEIGSKFSGYTDNQTPSMNYLSMNIVRNANDDVCVNMSDYTKRVCKEYGAMKIHSVPARDDLLDYDDSELLSKDEQEAFHTAVAKVLYPAKRSRPDILFAVSHLCGCVNKATENSKRHLDHLMGYIQGTADLGIVFSGGADLKPAIYADASFMAHSDARSRSGVLMMICGGPIGAYSTRQSLVTRSSTEAELVALETAITDATWLHQLIEIQTGKKIVIDVYQDNRSVLDLVAAGKPTSHRSRHIAMKYFRVCDCIEAGIMKLHWVCTQDMLADVLTKALGKRVFCDISGRVVR